MIPAYWLWLPSMLLTLTGVIGLDGTHEIVHRQRLVLASPWSPTDGCRDADVNLIWHRASGEAVGESIVVVPGCARIVILSPDQRDNLTEQGLHLQLVASAPIVATWVISPDYEWAVPAIVEQAAHGADEAASWWLVPDVDYETTWRTLGPLPYVDTLSFVQIKILNPTPDAVTVLLAGYSDDAARPVFQHLVKVQPYGEIPVRLDDIVLNMHGQLIVRAEDPATPILVWAAWIQAPAMPGPPLAWRPLGLVRMGAW